MPESMYTWLEREFGIVDAPQVRPNNFDDADKLDVWLKKFCVDNGIEHIYACSVSSDAKCPTQDEFGVGDRVQSIVYLNDRMPPWKGTIVGIEEHDWTDGHVRFDTLVDHDGFGLDRLYPCACAIRKIDPPDIEVSDNPIMDKLHESFPTMQFFGTISDALGAALDDE